MKRKNLNFAIDAVSLLVMLAMVVTGIVIHYLLPAGSGGRGGTGKLTLWGAGRHEWGEVHFWLAIATVVLIAVHVVLHWAWVCGVFSSWSKGAGTPSRTRRRLYGLGAAVAMTTLVAGFVVVGSFSVAEPETGHSCQGDGHSDGHGGGRGAVTHRYGNNGAGNVGASESHESGHIRGNMTMAEVADQTGIATAVLKERLGLPADTPDDERLGRLRQQHGFAMADLRSVVAELSEHR